MMKFEDLYYWLNRFAVNSMLVEPFYPKIVSKHSKNLDADHVKDALNKEIKYLTRLYRQLNLS